MKFDNVREYQAHTNQFANQKSVRNLKKTINDLLSHKNNDFYKILSALNSTEKIKLIQAIILGDGKKINKLLAKLPESKHNGKSLQDILFYHFEYAKNETFDLKRIVEHDHNDKFYLNKTSRKMIHALITNNPVETPAYMLRKAIQTLPEAQIGLVAKRRVLLEIDRKISYSIPDPAYNPEAPHVTKAIKARKIKENNLNEILKLALDKSEFIVLIRTFILQQNPTSHAQLIQKIDNFYCTLQYDKCLALIKDFMVQNPTFPLQSNILNKISEINPVEFTKNDTRRYFEMKWGQCYFGQEAVRNERFLSPIFDYYSKKYAIGKKTNQIDDPEKEDTIRRNFVAISELEHLVPKIDRLMEQVIRHKSNKYPDKGREYKENVKTRNFLTNPEITSARIWSKQFGIMRETSPYYQDEISKESQFNRSPDVHISKDPKKWPRKHAEVAFVGSLSGHIYFMIQTLEDYMKKNKHNPNLSAQINQFFEGLVATYITKGFHSMYEVIEVLDESHVKKLFGKYGVKLHLTLNEDSIQTAMESATQYTVDICNKKIVQKELLSKLDKTNDKPLILPDSSASTAERHNYSKSKTMSLTQAKEILNKYQNYKKLKFFGQVSEESMTILKVICSRRISDEDRYEKLYAYMSEPSNFHRDLFKVIELALGKEYFSENLVSIKKSQP